MVRVQLVMTVTASQDYSYQGLGNENVPFSGTIEGQTPAIKANTTIFGGLSSSARLNKQALSIGWSGGRYCANACRNLCAYRCG